MQQEPVFTEVFLDLAPEPSIHCMRNIVSVWWFGFSIMSSVQRIYLRHSSDLHSHIFSVQTSTTGVVVVVVGAMADTVRCILSV